MNRATAEVKWKVLRTRIKETWGELTDDDLDRFDGQRDKFVGHIQERYGMSRADVERRLQEIDEAEGSSWGGTARG
ncbi:UPF0337 protein [Luteitalea sp. TBR-22]|uniref:CsbD family protein n=1 Tax=Luteitalea sp. TBR-22 TaxID=2802971 RepID=UPI001AF2FDEC|nr:CsbD family protein [Luteitalea sp. TBR-22]BCS33645.1 UPF0337 protein [Luteitalea sp. TBR-22]